MSDRAWMYTGHPSQKDMTHEWLTKTRGFVRAAFANGQNKTWCPCPNYDNWKNQTEFEMGKHLQKWGFTPNYTVWTFHGESDQCARAEVVHRRTDEHGTGIEDLVQDFDDARDSDDEMEESANAFYEMMESSKRPLDEQTELCQLDAIAQADAESMDAELRQVANGFDYKTYYRCEEGYEEDAAKVPPRWCVDKMDYWEALVDHWCSEMWEASHNNAKERRGKMVGVPHHQRSVNLIQFGENWARHNKTEAPQMYDLYVMAHTASYKKVKAFSESDLEHPKNFTNISSHDKLVKYRDHGKARKGEDFNLSEGPIDPELVIIAGNGRPHGSIAIGDGLIRCPSSLRQIKARQTSSCLEITHRPRPVELAIEATIQKEREAMQAAMAEKDKEIRELEERTTALVEAERARNDASTRAIYELFVPEEGDERRRKRKNERKEELEEDKKMKEREEDKKNEKKEEKKEKELLLLLLLPPSSSFSFSFFFSYSSPLPSPSPPPPPPPSFTSSSLSLLLRSLDSSKKV
ncbi:hypothetical protein ZWY2020_059158 [Hordeum vulgare]|nr:hypothetical protein ZWY2020_059158 [Hordeum vulgare]